MALVAFGALTPLEMAEKLSWAPARMMGLARKGHLTPGADADITVLDRERGRAAMSFVAGSLIMRKGRPLGKGGTLLVTESGAEYAANSGLPHEVVDLSESKLYAGFS